MLIFQNEASGNSNFFEYLKKYQLEGASLEMKYKSYPLKYYAARLDSKVKNKKLELHEPKNDWRDQVLDGGYKLEKGVNKIGNTLQDKWDKSGVETKISGFFKKFK